MKKAIVLLLVCALILSCAAAFAAATPWNDKTVNVKITNSVTGRIQFTTKAPPLLPA